MNILIIEDEPPAVRRIHGLVKQLVPDAVINAGIDTIAEAVEWLGRNPAPDLILLDIQLADGLSFEIFDRTVVNSPVIFTTAYDEYALRAFRVNSIDYLLKPVDMADLERAINKLRSRSPVAQHLLESIRKAVQDLSRRYKSRFVIKVGEHLRTIDAETILYFYSSEKTTFCVTTDKRSFVLDYSLEQLEEMTDPARFYRVNRKYLVSSGAIADIISYTNSRLKLALKGSDDRDVIVARERVQDFKAWLDR